MKKGILIISILLITSLIGSGQTWEKINTGFNYIFRGIEFPNNQSQIGFAGGESLTYMGNGIVIKTTDGGISWTQLWTGTQQGLEGISFPDLNTGYVCGWSDYFAKTTNGGLNWTQQNPGQPADVYYYTDVEFKDALHGVAAAALEAGGALYATSDGGTTWVQASGINLIPYEVTYVTGDTYFLVSNGGTIMKSIDGGLNWTTVTTGLGLLLNINFYNSQIGIAVAEDGWFHKTYDGGATWQAQQTAFGNPLWRATAWQSQNDIIMCGTPETIYRSSDGGSTWVNDYPASAMDGAMYDVICFPDGWSYICGTQGYFYRKGPLLTAAFTSGPTTICQGGTVQFNDISLGSPTGWNWTFEGGTPANSTLQNPVVTYSTPGTYDVSLTVTKMAMSNTLNSPDMIHVEAPLSVAPAQPTGPTSICGLFSYSYTTTAVPQATSYTWTTEPASAGTFSGTGLTATLNASNIPGTFGVKAAGYNSCGAGPYSPLLNVNLIFQPVVYSLLSGGGYCEGASGYEIRLEDSDVGVDYQLIKDGSPLGAPRPGTGNSLSFGNQTEGTYTVSAANGTCTANMQGIAYINVIDPPATANTPTGPVSACEGTTSTYSSSLPANSTSLTWALSPPSAGTLIQPNSTTASINWTAGFTGLVVITVQGQNECGAGTTSPGLSVMVNSLPVPVIAGNTDVCKDHETLYSTAFNAGSTYTWEVTLGTITAGQGTNQITVLWNTLGTGSVTLTETNTASCEGIASPLSVIVNECTGIEDLESQQLILYPNPASSTLTLVSDQLTSPLRIRIISELGQEVLRWNSSAQKSTSPITLDIDAIPSGIYTLILTNGKSTFSRTFIRK